jgi:uncharacterized protein (TIGR03437 family)
MPAPARSPEGLRTARTLSLEGVCGRAPGERIRSAQTCLLGVGLLLALCSTASAQYTVTEYPGATLPFRIAAGPDGNLWFTDYPSSIGCITPAGLLTEYPASVTAASQPFGIVAGPDGNLWYTEMGDPTKGTGNRIGSITTAGVVTEYSIGLSPASSPYEITAGPDGNLWFTEYAGNRIGSISTSGVITEYAVPTPKSSPTGITAGPDGNLWFTEQDGNKIGSISSTGAITEYSAGLTAGSHPRGIAAGSDGALWFMDGGHSRVGRISADGMAVSYYSKGLTADSSPEAIAAGPDGALWFTERIGARIGRVTTDGIITEFSGLITPTSSPEGITAGPDGALWFTEVAGRIGRLAIPQPLITPGGVLSAASYLDGPVAPGELVSIFGASLGPTAPGLLTLDIMGMVSTQLDGIVVTFNGYLAPLTYASATQINAIVPYGVAGDSTAIVQVTSGSIASNQVTVPLAPTAPAIFTLNSSGSGPGAILNPDSSLNTRLKPAARGTTIQIFLTGEGLTAPAQLSGQVTMVNTSATGPLTPAPLLPVSVLIGGQPAHVDFAGEAPYVVAGVLQVNADIPSTAVSGANSIAVQVGTNLSQSGVTVWVK